MKTALIALLLLAAPTFAVAGEHGEGMMMDCPMHEHAMSDADRARHMDEMFAMLDADGNGVIDRAEFDKHHEHMRGMHEPQDPAEPAPKAAPAPAADEHAAHH